MNVFLILFCLFSSLNSVIAANEMLKGQLPLLNSDCLSGNASRIGEVMNKNHSQQIARDACAPGERFYEKCKPCDTFCSDPQPRNCSTPSPKAVPCISGCACSPGFRRTLQGACVPPMLCVGNNTGLQNMSRPINTTTTSAPVTVNLTCANTRCSVGTCIMMEGIPWCMSTPTMANSACQSPLEEWYQCMPCEAICTENNTVILQQCPSCLPGCACRSGYIRSPDSTRCIRPSLCRSPNNPK